MLSIQACGPNAASYFFSPETQGLHVQRGPAEYYLAGNEPSFWLGRGAERAGLNGMVGEATFRNLLAGWGPDGEALVRNAGKPDRQTGWDLTFSAPKSVSIVWVLGNDKLKAAIEAAHRAAVKAAITYLEDTACFSRRGKGGILWDPAVMYVAGFDHHTSRPAAGEKFPDPQLHTHCVGPNVAVRPDDTTGTLVSREIYRAKMAAGAVYQAAIFAR